MVFTEIRFDNFLTQLLARSTILGDKCRRHDFIIVADWIGITRELRVEAPNSRGPSAETCWCCNIPKATLKKSWWQEPFRYQPVTKTIIDFPFAALPSVVLHRRRYCWMHGVTRMLSTLTLEFYNILKKQNGDCAQFQLVMEQINPNWAPTPKKSSLQAKEMKQFIRGNTFRLLVPLFKPVPQFSPVLWPEGALSIELTCACQLKAVFTALRIYHDFAYTKWPPAASYIILWQARTTLLGFLAAQKIALTPVLHFMTNEALEFAARDRTAYNTLQESTEHQNLIDKRDAAFTTGHVTKHVGFLTGWQQMLSHQQLARVLYDMHVQLHQTPLQHVPFHVVQVEPIKFVPLLVGNPPFLTST